MSRAPLMARNVYVAAKAVRLLATMKGRFCPRLAVLSGADAHQHILLPWAEGSQQLRLGARTVLHETSLSSSPWMRHYPPPCISANPCRGKQVSWPGNASCTTAAVEVCGILHCRISTSARMPPSKGLPCSRVMPRATVAIFQRSRSSLLRDVRHDAMGPRSRAIRKWRCRHADQIVQAKRRIPTAVPFAANVRAFNACRA